MTDDARERFLREIAAQVPADRIAELHLFRPLRRGATETGVAVIAVEPLHDAGGDPAAVAERGSSAEGEGTAGDPKASADDVANSPASPTPPVVRADSPAHPDRHTVFTARYRLTRKGADRGKWEFEVVADADAPLGTVDTVVRGVQRRAGDDEEPERLTAEGVRAALDGQAWQPTT